MLQLRLLHTKRAISAPSLQLWHQLECGGVWRSLQHAQNKESRSCATAVISRFFDVAALSLC